MEFGVESSKGESPVALVTVALTHMQQDYVWELHELLGLNSNLKE